MNNNFSTFLCLKESYCTLVLVNKDKVQSSEKEMIIFFSIWGGLTLIGSFALLFYFALSK